MLIRPYRGIAPTIAQGVFLAETVTIIGDVTIGRDSSIWYGTVVRGDVHHIRIGERSNIQDNCVVHVTNDVWPTMIADDVSIGHGVIAHGCTIEHGCLIGMGSRLLDGSVIGEESLVGAGAVVPEGMHVPPRSLVLGVPGRVVRSLTEGELSRVRNNSRNYLEYKEIYLAEGQSNQS
jgi:gamma-carbonic anhydrase